MKHLIKIPERTLETNVIYCADNLEVMKQLPNESIDLIYIDPPFGTNSLRKSKTWDQEVQGISFYDSFGGGVKSYVSFLSDRLEQMHRLLKPTGSIYVHLDWRAVHYIKCKMDEIFGEKNFQREIIWDIQCLSGFKKTLANNWIRGHDSILFYSKKRKGFVFNKLYTPHDEKYLRRFNKIDKAGNRYFERQKGGPRRYLKDVVKKGKRIGDVWSDIKSFQQICTSKERLPYPTQKPLALLERIIKASSNEGDIVADFFCGCGTTLSASQKLGRKWLGVDANTEASKTIRKRMARDHSMKIDITPLKNLTKAQALRLPHFEFEKYCVRCIGGIPTKKTPGRDGGIDGKLIKDGTPIEVKQSEKIGRPVVDKFHKHLRKNGRGIIIALSFSKEAKEEAHRLKVDEGKDLQLITLETLIKNGTKAA